jgi:hypothetical protein
MKLKLIVTAIAVIVIGLVSSNLIHKVDDTEWQAVQYINGEVEIKDTAGVYFALFPKITEYPRNLPLGFYKKSTEESPNDESTRVTFNDGGTADIDATLRIALPSTVDQRREFHRQFSGNIANIKTAVWAHLSNVIKASGPLMSASENQASRKSEFNTVVLDQLNDGLYEMRRVERELDQTDEKGNKVRVSATEIVRDQKTNRPLISQKSPLSQYGVTVTQFSITETEYDPQTLKQFSTKKDAFLQAESAKAQREGEVQQKLMVMERGLREKAETEAKSNLEKAQAVITAMKEKEVAETEAAKILAVALKQKETAETEAAMQLAVAKLGKEAANENAEKIRILAQAEKDRISQAGAITEKEKVTLETQRETAIGVASALAKVNVPQIVISGSGGANGQGGSATQSELINLLLLKQNGYLDSMKVPNIQAK